MSSRTPRLLSLLAVLALLVAPGAAEAQNAGLSNVVGIDAGWRHSLAVRNDGTALAWGSDVDGQLGMGSAALVPSSFSHPVQVATLSNVGEVAGGGSHSLAVLADGTVRAWGRNGSGQLGNGTTSDQSNSPVQVSDLANARDVAAGQRHSLALARDGTVWAWGSNWVGELGNGTTGDHSTTPVQVNGLADVRTIAAGVGHNLGLRADGTVWAWGSNASGQLGDGTTIHRNRPVQVSGLTNVEAIAAGMLHSLAVRADGTVWAWGDNGAGQLGDGTTTNHFTPVQVGGGMTGVQEVAAGAYHSLARKSDGTVWAWGANGSGQLGDGSTEQRTSPVQVSGLTNAAAIGAGEKHSLARRSDGSVWAWGDNIVGQLGDGTSTDRRTPVQVADPSTNAGRQSS